MFLTHRNSEIPIRAMLGGDGPQHWDTVEISVACPLFFIEWSEGLGDDAQTKRCLTGALDEFEKLVAKATLGGSIRSIQLLTPPYVNGGSEWLMEPLVELVEGTIPDDDYPCCIYRVLKGNVYLESRETALSELTQRRTVYRHQSLGR